MRTRKALLCALLAASIGCGTKSEKKETAEDAVTPVQVAKVKRQPIQNVFIAEAVLFPVNQANITSKVSAPVKRFLVNRGDKVKQGQLVAELENRDLVSAADESRALLNQSESQYRTTVGGTLPDDLTRAQTDVNSARQALDAATKLFNNRTALVREGALAQKLADDAKVAQVQAQSQFDTAQRHLESLQKVSRGEQVKTAEDQVAAAKARYQGAQAQVGYTELRSPMNGVIADRPAYPGEIANPGTTLISIIDASAIVARLNVPAVEAGRMKAGDTATIAGPDGPLPAKVTVVSPAADPNSTTVEVWVRAANPAGTLKPGTTATVSITVATVADALVVPAAALLSAEEGATIVMVVGADSVAQQRKINVGVRQGDQVQVTSGLKPGEKVVTVGGIGLADKAKVKVEAAGETASEHE